MPFFHATASELNSCCADRVAHKAKQVYRLALSKNKFAGSDALIKCTCITIKQIWWLKYFENSLSAQLFPCHPVLLYPCKHNSAKSMGFARLPEIKDLCLSPGDAPE